MKEYNFAICYDTFLTNGEVKFVEIIEILKHGAKLLFYINFGKFTFLKVCTFKLKINFIDSTFQLTLKNLKKYNGLTIAIFAI